jgi:hypothetical protein
MCPYLCGITKTGFSELRAAQACFMASRKLKSEETLRQGPKGWDIKLNIYSAQINTWINNAGGVIPQDARELPSSHNRNKS